MIKPIFIYLLLHKFRTPQCLPGSFSCSMILKSCLFLSKNDIKIYDECALYLRWMKKSGLLKLNYKKLCIELEVYIKVSLWKCPCHRQSILKRLCTSTTWSNRVIDLYVSRKVLQF